jgi:S-formylglutathione hydrolase FrmB
MSRPRPVLAGCSTLLCALASACSNHKAPTPAVANSTPAAAPGSSAATSSTGHVITRRFHSDALGVDKDYVVYLPAGYEAQTTKHYPVFYYLHGLGGNERSWVKGGKLDAAADALALAAIIVMPDGDAGFYIDSSEPIDYDACLRDGSGLFPSDSHQVDPAQLARDCVRHRAYETYIVGDLVHDVDASFRTIVRRDGRALAGLSMGGFGALELALRHRDEFAGAASHSGIDALMYNGPVPYVAGKVVAADPNTWGAAFEPIGGWVRGLFGSDLAVWRAHDPIALVESLKPGELALYLDCGTEDDFLLNNQAAFLHDVLVSKHIDHAFYLGPGRHDFAFWGARENDSLAFLRDHVAKPE